MINPFEYKPKSELIEMAQGKAVCDECFGKSWNVDGECPICKGTGKQSLSKEDLDALAAYICDGCIIDLGKVRRCRVKDSPYSSWLNIFNYTTDWREAGRLLEKYHLQIGQLGGDNEWWVAYDLNRIVESMEDPLAQDDNPCQAIIVAVIIAELEGQDNEIA